MGHIPRGYRNNNPLNVRHSPQVFLGETADKLDPVFKSFIRMDYGYRCGMRIMRTYMSKYGLNTTAKIIARWAPPVENDTWAYIHFVCRQTSRRSGDPLYFILEDIIPLVLAMAHYENGQPGKSQDAWDGWALL